MVGVCVDKGDDLAEALLSRFGQDPVIFLFIEHLPQLLPDNG